MIEKIFYSLVLFPKIQFGSKIWSSQQVLLKIIERELGIIEVVTFSENLEKSIYFFHTDRWEKSSDSSFLSMHHLDLGLWKIYSSHSDLLKEVYEVLSGWNVHEFPFFKPKLYYRGIPFGVVLTITSKCNIFCYYCFNDIDYELKDRNLRANKDFIFWKKVIDELYDAGTRVVILTWGEPFVCPFFWELLDYLKMKWIFIHINTNGTLLSDINLEKLHTSYSVNLMVSMHEFNDADYFDVNLKGLEMTYKKSAIPESFRTAFSKKIAQLRKIQKYPNLSLEFLTILSWKNILNLEKIYIFGKKCGIPVHAWQFFRLYSTKNNQWATTGMMSLAINKMYFLNKKYGTHYKIVDPVPFCVTKHTDRAAEVIDWVLSDSHDVKTIITTQWYVQMMSAYDSNFWNIEDTDIKTIYASEFVTKQLNNGFLPKECQNCALREKCRGWSRMDAHIHFGDYGALDPLANMLHKLVE